jgi:hypothetical protein
VHSNNNLLAKSVDDLIQKRLDDAGQGSTIQAPEDAGLHGDPLVPGQPGTMGGGWQTISRVGTGIGEKSIPFTKFSGGFNPSDLHISNLLSQNTTGTPNRPRQFTATPIATTGAPSEQLDMQLTWYPPLTDTAGRWMTYVSRDHADNIIFQDLVESYLISRKDLGTGEEAVVAVVSHADQLISAARAYLEAEVAAGRNGATTDMTTLIATINAAFMVNVEDPTTHVVLYSEPFIAGHEQPFTFVDHTAINGHNYVYYIQALTPVQVESQAATCIPGAMQFASGLDVSPSGSWNSSYPDLTGSNTGVTSSADFAFTCGNLVTGVEISLVPIMDDALTINTAPQPDTDPMIVNTDPDPIKLQRPTTGTNTQPVTFIGRNMELWGGITAIDFGTGITFSNPGVNLTKTRIGTTDDWTYVATVTVDSTVTLGIKTMTVTLGSSAQARHSTIEVISEVASTVGPTLNQYNTVLYLDSADPWFMLTGTNLDNIQTLVPNNGSITIVSKTPTELEATYSGANGYKTVTCTLVGGVVSTGKDTFKLFQTHSRDRSDPDTRISNNLTARSV